MCERVSESALHKVRGVRPSSGAWSSERASGGREPGGSPPQDRQDGSSNGNPPPPHLSSTGQHLYSPAPPLSHTGVAQYQPPPSFPPSYQPLTYSQWADPYSHLGEANAAINPLHQPVPAGGQPQACPGRQSQEAAGLPSHHGRPACLLPHLSGLDCGALSAHRDGHALDAAGRAENLGLHDMGQPMDEVQRVDEQPLLLHDQTGIRQGPISMTKNALSLPCQKELVGPLLASGGSERCHQPPAPAGARRGSAAGLPRPPEPGGCGLALAPRTPGLPATPSLRAGLRSSERPQGWARPGRSGAGGEPGPS
ncbi:Transcription factor AP-2 gamma [Myotis davidii]|uniref:Transcription factor AP-2 gamma n=1 Tax=Myotis davidii TaxID=225400 RepID=L5M248_MYODS|nr:Transcription factor AP-2 gamma [Myotis davidii]